MNELDQHCACARGHENFGFVVHGPHGGRISLLDLTNPDNPSEIGVFPPEPGMPFQFAGGHDENNKTGAADIALTKDGTFALVSNGLANPRNTTTHAVDRVINVLKINLIGFDNENPPIQRLGFVEIGIDDPDRDTDPAQPSGTNVLSMGVTISDDDRFAFTANVNNRSLTVFDIMEAEGFFTADDNGDGMPNKDNLDVNRMNSMTMDFFPLLIQDVKQIPNTQKLLVTFTNPDSSRRGIKVIDFSNLANGGTLPDPTTTQIPTRDIGVDPVPPPLGGNINNNASSFVNGELKAIAIQP